MPWEVLRVGYGALDCTEWITGIQKLGHHHPLSFPGFFPWAGMETLLDWALMGQALLSLGSCFLSVKQGSCMRCFWRPSLAPQGSELGSQRGRQG